MSEVISTIVMFVPFLVILWLANFALRRKAALSSAPAGLAGAEPAAAGGGWRVWSILAYLSLAGLFGILVLVGLLFQVAALGNPAALGGALGPTATLTPAVLGKVGLGMWLPSLFGLLLLLPPVRRLVGRLIRTFDSRSPVHAVALSLSALVVVNLMVTVGFGLDSLAAALEPGELDIKAMLWAQNLTLVLIALVGVGWLTRRSLRQALQRAGVVWPSLKQLAAGTALAVGLAVFISVLEIVLAKVGIMAGEDVQRLTERLIGPLVETPAGIITLGLAAAIGEETVFRGALQPRFGLFLSTLLFALMHSTYGLGLATALVFGVGLVLGLVRLRANTTTSMVVHAVYNMTLGVIAALGLLKDF